MSSTKRTAIVTGASSGQSKIPTRKSQNSSHTGIGKSTAVALAAAGWNVVLTGRRQSAINETADMIAHPPAYLTIAGDITNEDFVRELFSSTIAKFGAFRCPLPFLKPRSPSGRLDLLFNESRKTRHSSSSVSELIPDRTPEFLPRQPRSTRFPCMSSSRLSTSIS